MTSVFVLLLLHKVLNLEQWNFVHKTHLLLVIILQMLTTGQKCNHGAPHRCRALSKYTSARSRPNFSSAEMVLMSSIQVACKKANFCSHLTCLTASIRKSSSLLIHYNHQGLEAQCASLRPASATFMCSTLLDFPQDTDWSCELSRNTVAISWHDAWKGSHGMHLPRQSDLPD